MKKDSQQAVAAFIGETAKLAETSMRMEDLYNAIVNRNPKADCYLYFDEDGKPKRNSYEDFRNQVFRTASKLSRAFSSIPAGSIVGLKLKNSPKWPVFFWAILMAGHDVLLIDARLPKENTDNLLRQSQAKAIIANDEEEFIVPSFRVNEVMNQEADYAFQAGWADHVIFCSSGTTGDAKMMIYSGKNMCAQVISSLDMPKEGVDLMYPGRIRILAMLPYHHVFGFLATYLWYAYYGKCHVYPASIATNDLLYACQKGECTHIFSVPMLWDGVAQAVTRLTATMKPSRQDIFSKLIAYNTHKISKKEAGLASRGVVMKIFQKRTLGTHVRFCISGGGYLSPKTANVVNGMGFPLYNGFGMTEVGITSVEQSAKVEQRLKCSIGHPFYSVQYKIKGPNGEPATEGELWVKTPALHEEEIIGGVRKLPDVDEEGFFPTGDIANVDVQGNYYIKGRIKDTIILNNGENVFPDEIEFYFKGVKNLNNVVCLGAKHPGDADEKITLVCECDNSIGDKEIAKIYDDIRAINNTLPSEKKVQAVLIDKNPLPISGSMKIKRFEIRKAIEAGSKEFYNAEAPKEETFNFDGFDPEMVNAAIEQVTQIFSKTLSLPAYKISPTGVWNTDLGGDSMSYIEMVQKIDETFGISVPEELYGVLKNVQEFAKEVLELKNGIIDTAKKKPSKAPKGKKN